jgi:hypothetical protein
MGCRTDLSDNAGAHRVLLVGTVLLLERKQPREKDARREEYSAWNHGAIFAEVVEHERFEARDLHLQATHRRKRHQHPTTKTISRE